MCFYLVVYYFLGYFSLLLLRRMRLVPVPVPVPASALVSTLSTSLAVREQSGEHADKAFPEVDDSYQRLEPRISVVGSS